MSYRNYANTNGFIVAQNGTGDFRSISSAISAITAASMTSAIIYLTTPTVDGSYIEDITVPAGTLITTMVGSNQESEITILGSISFSGTGKVVLDSLTLETNGSSSIDGSGSNSISLTIDNCRLLATNANSVELNNPNFALFMNNTTGDVLNDGFKTINEVSAASASYRDVTFANTGVSNSPNIFSSCLHQLYFCNGRQGFKTSDSGYFLIKNSIFNTTLLTIPCIQCTNITSAPSLQFCSISSGANACCDVSSGSILYAESSSLGSLNTSTYCITGNGSLSVSDVVFVGTADVIESTLTVTGFPTVFGTLVPIKPDIIGSPVYIDTDGYLGVTNSGTKDVTVRIDNIDLTTLGTTLLYTPPTGYNFVLTNVICFYTTITGFAGARASGSLGTNSPSFNNIIFTASPLSGNSLSTYSQLLITYTLSTTFATNSSPLYLNITNNDDSSVAIGSLILSGILIAQ